MEKKDAGRIKSITTKKLSDFIQLEEGSTGKQNALKAGAMLGGSVLAQVLLTAIEAADASSGHTNNYSPASHTNNTYHNSTGMGGGHNSAI